MTTNPCGAKPNASHPLHQALTCYRPTGHPGEHAAHLEQHDEIVFWRPEANGDLMTAEQLRARVTELAGIARHLQQARGEDQQRLMHYEGQIADDAQRLEALRAETAQLGQQLHDATMKRIQLEMDQAVPGVMVCDSCGLVVYTNAINVATGEMGVPIAPAPEPCPNNCVEDFRGPEGGIGRRARLLRPQSWKESDAQTTANLLRVHDALEQLLRLSNHYAELLNQYDGGRRMVFDHPGEWIRRIGELEAAGPEGVPAKAPGLLARIQDELENHRACYTRPAGSRCSTLSGMDAAEAIGFHRGLHWLQDVLLGRPLPGPSPELPAPLTYAHALELAEEAAATVQSLAVALGALAAVGTVPAVVADNDVRTSHQRLADAGLAWAADIRKRFP